MDSAKYIVTDSNGQVFARYGSMADALKGARWLLSDGQVPQARIEWAEQGETRSRSVSRIGRSDGATFASTAGRASVDSLDVTLFRPAMTGAVVVGAAGLLSWALVSALQVLVGG